MTHTFLWHDYETFGAVPRRDRPAQFAGVRTDAELNEIGAPIMLYCKPTPDNLPEPQACLITGITPQQCLDKGVTEREFAASIEAAFAQSGTIGVGYNSIRFDDEVTRFLFWRNLIPPYDREWRNECGRWDLLDVVRTAYALRPEGINWLVHAEGEQAGKPSFKLEDLARANGLMHEAAHDALSDVRATIAFARLLREKQGKLFDFCFKLHKKDAVLSEMGLPGSLGKPILHVSGMYGTERGCMALVFPLAQHPTNKNEIIVWDLLHDPAELSALNAQHIRARLFVKAADLPEGITRLPIKTIHINKSPIVIGNLRVLSAERAAHWNIDVDAAIQNAERAASLPDMSAIWAEVFKRDTAQDAPRDVDEDLYSGFIQDSDRRTLDKLRGMQGAELATARVGFHDARLEELLFRYRARNFPASLNDEEMATWQAHCQSRIFEGAGGALQIDDFLAQLDTLQASADERDEAILSALSDYAEGLAAELEA